MDTRESDHTTMADGPDRAGPPGGIERRIRERTWVRGAADIVFRAFRIAYRLAGSFYAAFGLVVLAGGIVTLIGTWAFAEIAGHVREGATQRFDEAALLWLAQHRSPILDRMTLEFTALGTGLVVMTVVGVAAMFLYLSHHRFSAGLLLLATAGGLVLNNVLKLGFDRDRPSVVPWLGDPASSSFPSGHAMSAAIVYGTVAYLAARLQKRAWTRALTALVAILIIAGIAVTRLYLGVHYPSDVLAGIIAGFVWAGFCMVMLETMQRLAKRRAPEMLEQEVPPEKS
jgi:undecaprenyl-diphosphatase